MSSTTSYNSKSCLHGWKLQQVEEREEVPFDWMDGKPAPDAGLELLACPCTRSCKLSGCVCLANGLKCIDICTLKECQNQVERDEETDLYNSDDAQMTQMILMITIRCK